MTDKLTIGYVRTFEKMQLRTTLHHIRLYGDHRDGIGELWCVEGPGVTGPFGDTAVADSQTAIVLRGLLDAAYERGRQDGERTRAQQIRNLLNL